MPDNSSAQCLTHLALQSTVRKGLAKDLNEPQLVKLLQQVRTYAAPSTGSYEIVHGVALACTTWSLS